MRADGALGSVTGFCEASFAPMKTKDVLDCPYEQATEGVGGAGGTVGSQAQGNALSRREEEKEEEKPIFCILVDG